jgi:hypothetical protein
MALSRLNAKAVEDYRTPGRFANKNGAWKISSDPGGREIM